MQILIIGATGRTGSLVLLEALRRGHIVTALVRKPSLLDNFLSTVPPTQKSNLTVVRGSPLDASDVVKAITTASTANSQLAVISTLGTRRTSENPWAALHPTDSPPRMMADSIANILSALTHTIVGTGRQPKVVYLSALGVGSSVSQAHWLPQTILMHSNIKFTYEDHEAVEAELNGADQGVKWVIVRPGRLTEGDDGSEAKVWPAEKGRVGMMAKASRGAVARFLVNAAERSEWDGKDPIVLS